MASHKQHRQQQQQQHRQPYRYLAVLDFEASCDNARTFSSQEIIELPCVVIDAHLPEAPIVCEFHRYVQPVLHPALPAFCTEQTGIEQHTVDAADPFPVVHAAFAQFIADRGLTTANTLMVTCGDWDLKTMLPLQLTTSGIAPDRSPQLLKSWCNIKTAFQALYYRPRQVGMAGMLQVAGLPLVGRHHSGIDDSRNIAAIARRMLQLGHIFLPTSGAASGGPTSSTAMPAQSRPSSGLRLRSRNINLPAALLSRFDVLFLILDKPDFEDDIRLATHVTYVHQNNRHMERQGEQNAVDPTALKCYISMARSVAPRLTATTAGFLVNAYAHLRQREDVSELQYTCARTLLSLIRMATALARLRFSEDVDEGEVEEALRLLEVSKASVNNKVGGKAEDPISSIYRIIREMSSEGRSAGQIAKEVDIPSIRSRITARGIGDDDLQRCIEHYSDANLWIVGRNGKALVWVTADDDDDEEDDSNADPPRYRKTHPNKSTVFSIAPVVSVQRISDRDHGLFASFALLLVLQKPLWSLLSAAWSQLRDKTHRGHRGDPLRVRVVALLAQRHNLFVLLHELMVDCAAATLGSVVAALFFCRDSPWPPPPPLSGGGGDCSSSGGGAAAAVRLAGSSVATVVARGAALVVASVAVNVVALGHQVRLRRRAGRVFGGGGDVVDVGEAAEGARDGGDGGMEEDAGEEEEE
ncbi:MCM2/3/5 family-domain-containing protein [Zopfochytrium polystomum]|nr:MCM2/3/5 family-domain-containing protein [Zopfochytrium polystomum]